MLILVTTDPFGKSCDVPRRQLETIQHEVEYNTHGRRLTRDELIEYLKEHQPDIIIAGTEKYDSEILDIVPDLLMISRVGIGLDNIDLDECKKRKIIVTNTPDAPSNAVAELTICQMLNALRRVQITDKQIRQKTWDRFIGRDLRDCDIGIFGCGRIGRMVIEKLQGLKPRRIFANDIISERMHDLPRTEPSTKMQILAYCDVICVHIPYNEDNHHFISEREFALMDKQAVLINNSRGGIVDEKALVGWLESNPMASAAIDTFEEEPYINEDLSKITNTYLTPHLGSCTEKSRFDMEVGATEEVLNFLQNKPFNNLII
jgi:D-3-phosphoglycerate dehydrogenase